MTYFFLKGQTFVLSSILKRYDGINYLIRYGGIKYILDMTVGRLWKTSFEKVVRFI